MSLDSTGTLSEVVNLKGTVGVQILGSDGHLALDPGEGVMAVLRLYLRLRLGGDRTVEHPLTVSRAQFGCTVIFIAKIVTFVMCIPS